MKQIWDQTTCGKHLKQHKTKASYLDEMQDFDGQKLKTNQEKADAFAKTFAKKTKEVVSEGKIKENEF